MDGNPAFNGNLYKHSELTEKIIGAFYEVYSKLGYGFLEDLYGKAMLIELKKRGLTSIAEKAIEVYYEDQIIGKYYADIIVNDLVILELKSVKSLITEHEAQLLNYLKATPYEVGLLVNFGPKPETKRRSFNNDRKEWFVAKGQS